MSAPAEDILEDLIDRVAIVRRWLLTLGVLRSAALWLTSICLYIGFYALLDHHVHFGTAGRLAALILLLGLLGILSYYFVRTLRRDMTYSRAANHVENKQSFDQQLVAAVEYYEKGEDYPYSKRLARALVVQVDAAAQDFDFGATVEKWRGYVLAGCIVLCLAVVGLFVRQNVLYFSAYMSRLFQPFSPVAPVPTTVLRSVTGDLVTGPHAPVTLVAQVEGRTPETIDLVWAAQPPADANETSSSPVQRLTLHPTTDAAGHTTFTGTPSFDALGVNTYHFETPGGRSEAHTITVAQPPTIESITALMLLPNGDERIYTQEVENRKLEVLSGSRVELQVKATTPLREATVSRPDEMPIVQALDGGHTFRVRFTVDRAMTLMFTLVGVEGLSNSEPETLHIAIKSDEPAQFALVSPEGDCLATNVASVPIVFEITDDFGLTAAELRCELPDGRELVLDTSKPHNAKQTQVSGTLELEDYDLQIGDSILLYAQASDIETGSLRTDANACSDITFIEIRPYRQYWHPEGGGSSQSPGMPSKDLAVALEYTRAILKKTWTLAQNPDAADRADFEALCSDIEYCSGVLTALRDDPESEFDEDTKATITDVVDLHTQGRRRLSLSDADGALPPERDAYRTLRKLIDELHMKLSQASGQSVPQEEPERVSIQEKPDAQTPQDQQRTENQLEKAQQEIENLARQQESLKADLAKSLEQQSQSSDGSQSSESTSSSSSGKGQSSGSQSETSDQQSQESGSQNPGSDAPSSDGSEQKPDGNSQTSEREDTGSNEQTTPGQEDQKSEDGAKSEDSAKGEDGANDQAGQQKDGQKQTSSSAQGSQGQNQSAQQGDSSGQGGSPSDRSSATNESPSQSSSADTDAQMRMLEAKQKTLRQQAAELAEELAQMALPEFSSHATARDQAKQQLDEAIESMKDFEETLSDQRYHPDASEQTQSQMNALADEAAHELAQAGKAIEQGLSPGQPQTEAEKAEALAKQLAADAESLDESVSPQERDDMLKRLEAAERLLENMTEAQWSTVSHGGSSPGLVYTKGGAGNRAEAARLLAQQFWSLAIQERNRQVRPVEDEPSDVEYYEVENNFFENTAKFKPPDDAR